MRTSVSLSDLDLARLVDSDDADTRKAALAAADRIAAPARFDTSAHVATLVADVIREAKNEGRLISRHESISFCRYCSAKSTWGKQKRRRTEVEFKLSGREFAHRFLIVRGHISVGGCMACVEQALPVLRVELARFPIELPESLRLDGAPVYRRWDRCRCEKCGWAGNEGQLGKLTAIMGGKYPGKCPSCGVEHRPLGHRPFERVEGFDVVQEAA